MKVKIIFPSEQPTPEPKPDGIVLTLRRYGDEFMVKNMWLDTNKLGTSNFQNIDFLTFDNNNTGTFGAVTNFQPIDVQAVAYLKSIQPVDAFSLNGKMNWLGVVDVPNENTDGRPYMVKQKRNCWGTMGFGGQKIRVEATDGAPVPHVFKMRYQQDTKPVRDLVFYKVIGLQRADMVRPLAELLQAGLVQRATWATYSENTYKDTVEGGVIYNPVWSPIDYPTNYGKQAVYIAAEFCLPSP